MGVFEFILYPFKKVFGWIRALMSDSEEASSKRFLAIQSFYFIIYMGLSSVGLKNVPLANAVFLMQLETHLFYIVILGMGFATVDKLVKLMKAQVPIPTQTESPTDIIPPAGTNMS